MKGLRIKRSLRSWKTWKKEEEEEKEEEEKKEEAERRITTIGARTRGRTKTKGPFNDSSKRINARNRGLLSFIS